MSTEVINEETQDFLMHEHFSRWRISNLSIMKPKGIQIPVFSPIPNINVKFCFEICYQKIYPDRKESNLSTFKVVLVKLPFSEIQPSLKLELEFTFNHTNGTLFKKYKPSSGISVHEMDSITCINDTCTNLTELGYWAAPGAHVYSNALILKLRMRFFGHLSSPSMYRHEMLSLNNLKKFAEDFRALTHTNAFSDITIRTGGKDFPAHKAVLAAHSPVFMKMLESDFLESKTNSITISDFKCDIFECFLKYLYSGDIEDKSWSNVRELYFLADKYDVQTLKKKCAEIMESVLTVDQVYDVLAIAYDYDDSDLKEEAKRFAAEHFQEIVHTAEWNALVASHPIIGYELLASVYSVPKNALKSKEP